jgi:hypothetical protein
MVRFPGRHWRALLVIFAGLALLAGAVPALASVTGATAARASAPPPGGSNAAQAWSVPAAMPKGTALGTGAAVTPIALDCPATGDCTAVGSASPASAPGTSSEGFVDSQVNGVWQAPQQIPGLSALTKHNHDEYAVPVDAVSCSSPGNCAAGGDYTYDGDVSYPAAQPFVVSETKGKWGSATVVPGIVALNTAEAGGITSISCTAPGYCTAAGTYATKGPTPYVTQSSAFTVDEVAGKWRAAHPVLGLRGPGGSPFTYSAVVSCASPGDCAVGAQISAANGSGSTAQVVSDTKFKWSPIHTIKGMTQLGALDCTGVGDCAAAGGNQAAQSSGGNWSSAKTLGGTSLGLASVSCSSNANCLAGGEQATSAVVVAEKNGVWETVTALSNVTNLGAGNGYANVGTVSCTKSGQCEAGGGFSGVIGGNSVESGFAVQVDQGKPLTPQKFKVGGVGLISCDSAGSCGGLVAGTLDAEGFAAYNDFSQRLLTSTALALSSAKTTYGHENAEKISVVVSPESRDPGGEVVIKVGKTTLCAITLKSAKGSCKLTAKRLKPGSYALIASYLGAPGFKPSTSAGRKLTVVK